GFDRADIGNLHHVEQRGDARHQVLSGGRRRRQDVRVVRRQLDQQRRDVLGQAVGVGGIVGQAHLGDPGDFGGGLGDRGAAAAGDEDMHVGAGDPGDLGGGGDRVQRRRLQRGAVMFGDDEDGHQITRASSFSLSTSSATEPTLTPPSRFFGSSTLRVTRRGSLSRRSVVTMAGRSKATVSSPPSTSRVTSACRPLIASLEAKVACGQPSSAASIWPVWLQSSSIACLPMMTISGCSRSITAFSNLATASGCNSASVWISTPRSAPIASAVRIVSWHWGTPAETAMTSSTVPASRRRSASSTAISSNGFIDILTLAVSTPVWSALTRTLTL